MDLNHSMAFKSAAANCRLQDYLQMPTPTLPQIPQPIYEAAQEDIQQAKLNQLQNHLKLFWKAREQEMREMSDYKQHQLPLARIKKVMKSDEHVKMISADAPLIFSKACEMFILELTFRSWMQTEEGNRRTLQRADIANAISKSRSLDFLLDVVPREQHDEDDRTTGRRVQGQRIPHLPYGFKALDGSNGFNGFSVPSSFNVPNGPNDFTGPPFPMMGPNLFQQNHNAGEETSSQMLDMNRGRNMPLLTNNGVQLPMMPINQYQMNRYPVAEEGFYGGNMGGEVANGMYHPNRMNSADQSHQKFYADNQAGSSNFLLIGRNEAEYQAGQLNGMHFGMVGRNRADLQAGTSNGMQFGTFGCSEAEFQPGTSNSGMFGRSESQIQSGPSNFSMFGRDEEQLQSGPFNFGVFGRNEAQLQTGPSNLGIRNEAQLQSGNGKRSRLL